MAETLESLAARIAALEDKAAIHELKHSYFRGCDRKQPDVVRNCFRPDAVIDAAYMGVHEGRESFVNLFEMVGCRDTILDMHHAQNPVIVLDGPDRAHGTWDLYFHQINLDTSSAAQVSGYYEDEYVREEGRWWIARSTFRVTSTLMTEVGAGGALRNTLLGR